MGGRGSRSGGGGGGGGKAVRALFIPDNKSDSYSVADLTTEYGRAQAGNIDIRVRSRHDGQRVDMNEKQWRRFNRELNRQGKLHNWHVRSREEGRELYDRALERAMKK